MKRWFLILANSVLLVLPMHDVFLSQDMYIGRQNLKKKGEVTNI